MNNDVMSENGGVIITKMNDLLNWSRLIILMALEFWDCLLRHRVYGCLRIYL